MNKKIIILSLVLALTGFKVTAQNIGINYSGNNPDESAVLDLDVTDRGFLMPRLTTAQRDAIVNPADALLIFNTDTRCYEGYSSVLSDWKAFGCLEDAPSVPAFPSGFVHCDCPTEIVDVTNPVTNKTWMDRNLGASQAATSSTDAASYGDLYQWGRFADGHQCRTSATTSTRSSTDTPKHGDFIIGFYNWRNPQNDNLWQGVNGTNNPCPDGYRLPTETEWNEERLSWVQSPISSTNNAAGAFASPLKLPLAGYRDYNSGALINVGSYGHYWSSTVAGAYANYLYFYSGNTGMYDSNRANGRSVRCLRD